MQDSTLNPQTSRVRELSSSRGDLLARLAGLIGDLPYAVLCLDRSWHITWANPEAIRISRLRPELFASTTFWELHPFLLDTEAERRYRQAMESRQPDHFEYVSPLLNAWVDLHLVQTDEGIALVYRDITLRKQAEQRDAASTQQMRQLFEAIPDAVVVIDEQWRFSFANQLAAKLTGRADMIGQDIFELFPGNLDEPFQSAYRTCMQQRKETEFEAFHGAPLNLWVKVLAKPFERGIIVFFSDITLRKNAELREQETSRRLEQVLAVTSDSVVALDRDWRYTYLNANAERLIDPERRLLGKVVWDELPMAVGGPAWEVCHEAMDQRRSGYTEVFYPAPVNAWLILTAQPSHDGIVVFFRDITQQRAHQEVVQGQLQQLEAVQRASRLATWEHDAGSGIISYGPGAFPVFGHPLEHVSTFAQLETILQPEHLDRVRAEATAALETAAPLLTEFAVTAADGATVWIESRGQAALSAAGTPVLRGMSIDITSRHAAQQELVASEARYRVLADLNPHAIWMGDSTGHLTYANQGFLTYVGRTLEECLEHGWLPALALQEHQRVTTAWRQSVATGADFDIEALIREAASGELRYWHLRAAPVRDPSGTVLHWLGVAQDIHASKTYTASLRAEQMETERRRAELESIYETTPIGLALLDPVHFTFLNLNEHEASMLGASRDQLLGRPLYEIAPPEKMPGLLELMRSVAAGTPVRNHLLEGELTPRPGEQRAWTVSYTPIFNADGSVRAISTASIEITQQKRAEAALIQSEKLAAVGRLASSISHEINNPLEAITNLLYLIAMNDALPGELKTYVEVAQAELTRVSQIATQTLRFHRQAVAPTLVTPADLVDAVIHLYTGRLSNSNIKVDARYSTSTRILCFENDIRQVLNNLIANAIDAMRNGGRLMVRAHQVSAPVPGVRITIADTGHGMNTETLARIFEPFFTTKDLNGTGLGLWISAGILERHQGRMSVRSSDQPGRHGTVFTLILPCSEEQGTPHHPDDTA